VLFLQALIADVVDWGNAVSQGHLDTGVVDFDDLASVVSNLGN